MALLGEDPFADASTIIEAMDAAAVERQNATLAAIRETFEGDRRQAAFAAFGLDPSLDLNGVRAAVEANDREARMATISAERDALDREVCALKSQLQAMDSEEKALRSEIADYRSRIPKILAAGHWTAAALESLGITEESLKPLGMEYLLNSTIPEQEEVYADR